MSFNDTIRNAVEAALDEAVSLTNNPIILSLLVPPLGTLAWYVISYLTSPLRKYPGPPLAALTNYWRMYHASGGQMHIVSKKLHEKFGPVVRMAPNYLDLDCPSLIKTVFESKGIWRKTEWHGVSGAKVGNQIFYNIFSETNPVEHARMKKPIAKYFTAPAVLAFESHVDDAITSLVEQIDAKFAGTGGEAGKPFDFGEWIMFFAWDAVGHVTWSAPVGYLAKGCDFNGTLHASEKAMDYLVTIGMQPSLDAFFDKNPVYRIGPPSFTELTNTALGHLVARYTGADNHDAKKPDFMDRYIEAKAANPDVVDDPRILSYLLVNIAAGADTTAASIKSIFYLSLKHQRVWRKLESEILSAGFGTKNGASLPAPYSQARRLTYLECVVREALRLIPGNCFAQERYVPAGGIRLPDGSFVPEGTAIGFNAYIIHRNKDIWGDDAEEFKPERWLRDVEGGETEEEFKDRLTLVNNCDLSFGGGVRKCIGMNVGMLKVYKTIASLISLYEWELDDPKREWTIHNSIFPRQSGVVLRCRKREEVKLTA